MANVVNSALWFIVFWLLSFIVAFFGASWYILFSAFSPCLPCLEDIANLFLKCVQFPHTCAKGVVSGKPLC